MNFMHILINCADFWAELTGPGVSFFSENQRALDLEFGLLCLLTLREVMIKQTRIYKQRPATRTWSLRLIALNFYLVGSTWNMKLALLENDALNTQRHTT